MSLDHWKAILETHGQVQALINKQLPTSAAHAKKKAARLAPEDLQSLHEKIIAALRELQTALLPQMEPPGAAWTSQQIEDVIRPLSYLFDETVLLRLPEEEQSLWPLLQKHLFHEDAGGNLFYEFADHKLSRADTHPLIFEVLHFCLSAGFQGYLENWPARINDYKHRLAERIPQPDPVPPPAPAPAPAEPVPYEFPLQYYLTAGFVIVALPVVLWVLSN